MQQFLTTPKDREALLNLARILEAELGEQQDSVVIVHLFTDGTWRVVLCYQGEDVAVLLWEMKEFTFFAVPAIPTAWLPDIETQMVVLNRYLQPTQS